MRSLTRGATIARNLGLDEEAQMVRTSTSKLLEIQSLASALLLSVAASGLYAQASLDHTVFRSIATIAFCVALFCFMSATLMSVAFLVPLMTLSLDPRAVLHTLSPIFVWPYYSFIGGYVCTVGGATAYFLAMDIQMTHTMGCLVFCSCVAIGPTCYVLYAAMNIMQQGSMYSVVGDAVASSDAYKT